MNKIVFKNILIIGLLFCNLALITFLGLGKIRNNDVEQNMPRQKGPASKIIHELNFDDLQIRKFEASREIHRYKVDSILIDFASIKEALYPLINQQNDKLKDSLIQELGIKQSAIEAMHFQHFLEIKKICTPAQVKKYEALTKEFSKMFGPPKKEIKNDEGK